MGYSLVLKQPCAANAHLKNILRKLYLSFRISEPQLGDPMNRAGKFVPSRAFPVRLVLILTICALFAGAAFAQEPEPTPPEDDPTRPVRVKTDLVTLTLTVT